MFSPRSGYCCQLALGCAISASLVVVANQAAAVEKQDCPLEALDVPKEQFHLYLLIGQSNMSGRGEMSAEDRLPTPNVYALDRQDKWKPAAHPLHFDKPRMVGVGLGIDFAKQMVMANPDATIGLIPCAVGGTSLKQWSKDSELYNSALKRTQKAMQRGTLKGILWHQGEADCSETLASTYGKRLAKVVKDIREDLEQPDVPFVLGEIGEFRVGVKRRSDIVIEQQRSVPELVSHSACVNAEGLKHKGDFSHFDATSLRKFGERYAAAMLEVQEAAASDTAAHKTNDTRTQLNGCDLPKSTIRKPRGEEG